jgi:hypothetical protein
MPRMIWGGWLGKTIWVKGGRAAYKQGRRG